MKHCIRLALLPTFAGLFLTTAAAQDHWPQWRGPLGTGQSKDADPPVEWSAEKNIRWKVEVPGRGNGTPIIWGDRIFLLTAVPFGEEIAPPEPPAGEGGRGGRRMRGIKPTQHHKFMVMALDRKDGAVVWEKVAIEALPHEGTHGDGTWASASAITDGEHVFAYFGSRGLYAYDMKGELVWEKMLGEMKTRNSFGEGSTPALHGDTIVVQWDHEGPSFIVALDKKTGDEKWRKERDEVTSWATPIIVEVGGKAQVVSNGTTLVRAYDLESGDVLWECGGMTTNAIPSPVVHDDGTAYIMSGFRGSKLLAIDLKKAKGDLSESEAVLWTRERDTPYVPSPLLFDDVLYFLKSNSGILTAVDRMTGEEFFGAQRLAGIANVYASPVAAAGRVYLVDREGTIEVLEHGPEYKVLATNVLEDKFDASPALAGDELYLRGTNHLYCIAEGD